MSRKALYTIHLPNSVSTIMYARKTLITAGTTVATSFLGYLSWFFITNNISQSYIGSIGFALSLLGFFGILTDLGFSSAHIKKVSEGRDVKKCLGTFIALKAVLISIFTLATLSAIWGYRTIYPQRDFSNSYDEGVIYLLLIWAVISNISSVATATFLGQQKVVKAQIILVISALIQCLLTIAVVTTNNDVYLLASTWIVGAFTSAAVSLFLIRGTGISPPSLPLLKEYFRYSLPLIVVSGFGPVVLYLDKIMIKLFWENADVSIYWNAQKFAGLPESMTTAVMVVLFPAFSALVVRGSIDTVREMTVKAERYISMFILPTAFLLMAVSGPFIRIFSDISYGASTTVFTILLVWVIFKSLAKPYSIHFASFNRPSYAALASLVFFPVNIILNLVLIPDSIYGIELLGMGVKGAALATLIGSVFSYIIIRILSRRLIRIGLNSRIPRHIVAAGISSSIVYLFHTCLLPISRFYELIAVFAVGMGLYVALLWAFGELTRGDLRYFLETLNPRKMVGYMRDEVLDR